MEILGANTALTTPCSGTGGICNMNLNVGALLSDAAPQVRTVAYGLQFSNLTPLGEIRTIPKPATHSDPAGSFPDTVYCTLPSRPLSAGEKINVEFRSSFRYFLGALKFTVKLLDASLTFTGTKSASPNFDLPKFDIGSNAESFTVVLASRGDGPSTAQQNSPTGELLATLEVVVGSPGQAETARLQISSLSSVANIANVALDAASTGAILHRGGVARGPNLDVTVAKVHFVSQNQEHEVVGIFGFATGTNQGVLLNLAVLDGVEITRGVTARAVSRNGALSTPPLLCSSTVSTTIISVTNCAAVLSGSETAGTLKDAITVAASGLDPVDVPFKVFFPVKSSVAVQISPSSVRQTINIRPIAGWFEPPKSACSKLRYEQGPDITAVTASFAAGTGTPEIQHTDLAIADLIRLTISDTSVAALDGSRVQAKSPGQVAVTAVGAGGVVWGSASVTVHGTDDIDNVLGFIGLSVTLEDGPNLKYPGDTSTLSVQAVFEDDTRIVLSHEDGLHVTSLDPKALVASNTSLTVTVPDISDRIPWYPSLDCHLLTVEWIPADGCEYSLIPPGCRAAAAGSFSVRTPTKIFPIVEVEAVRSVLCSLLRSWLGFQICVGEGDCAGNCVAWPIFD